jgi:hypothetical protein
MMDRKRWHPLTSSSFIETTSSLVYSSLLTLAVVTSAAMVELADEIGNVLDIL